MRYHLFNSSPLISQIVEALKYPLTKRSSILANQRQRTRGGIVVGGGDDAAVRQQGGRPDVVATWSSAAKCR